MVCNIFLLILITFGNFYISLQESMLPPAYKLSNSMAQSFKYEILMQEKGIKSPCPFTNGKEVEIEAFRWGNLLFEADNNFLPNYIYNKLIKYPSRRNAKPQDENDGFKCGMCGLSFFKTIRDAQTKWEEVGDIVRNNLKYTHLLSGRIEKNMGVVSGSDKPHFLLYEYNGVSIVSDFIINEYLMI